MVNTSSLPSHELPLTRQRRVAKSRGKNHIEGQAEDVVEGEAQITSKGLQSHLMRNYFMPPRYVGVETITSMIKELVTYLFVI